MVRIANISHVVQRLRAKDGTTVEIAPGAFADVEIEREDKHLRSKERMRLVSIGGTEKQAAKTARERTPVAPADALKDSASSA